VHEREGPFGAIGEPKGGRLMPRPARVSFAVGALALMTSCAAPRTAPPSGSSSVALPTPPIPPGGLDRLSILSNPYDGRAETSLVYAQEVQDELARTDRRIRKRVVHGLLPQDAMFEANARRLQIEHMLSQGLSDGVLVHDERRQIDDLLRTQRHVVDRAAPAPATLDEEELEMPVGGGPVTVPW
jgi:hypothetical protein